MGEKISYEELAEKIRELEKDAEDRLEFIKLLTGLSKIFISIAADEIDEKVEEVLQRIGEILGVDRTDFIQNSEETGHLEFTHSWTARGIESYPRIITDEHYPWFTEKLRSSENHIHFPSIDALPKDAARDKESLKKMGIKSGLIIPYSVEGPFFGAIAFGSHKQKISWSDTQIQRIRLLGEVIFNALRRKEADFELLKRHEERLKFEQLLMELSSSFVNIPADQVDGHVETVIRSIGEVLEIDRATFWQISSESGEFEVTHSWTASGIEPLPRIIAK